jgi:hypothetical protein
MITGRGIYGIQFRSAQKGSGGNRYHFAVAPDDERQTKSAILGANLLRGAAKRSQRGLRVPGGRAACPVRFHLRLEFIAENTASSNTLVAADVPSATNLGSVPLLSRMRHSSASGR